MKAVLIDRPAKGRYRAELDANPEAAAFVEKVAVYDGTVTLLYGAKNGEISNAAVLKEWLKEKSCKG